MSSGNNRSTLMEWVNLERKHFGLENVVYDYQHLKDTSFVYQLLQKIHPTYFTRLNHLTFQFQAYLAAIEEYLIEVEGKKISRAYKKQIIQKESVEQIIKVILCQLLQGNQKGQYISRIVEMPVEVQGYLMQQIKRVKSSIENFIEIKDILSTVQRLQQQNQSLKERIKSTTQINQQLLQNITDTKIQKTKIEKEIKTYQNEKKQVFQELQIVDLKQYIQIYKMMKQENEELNYCLQEIEDNRRDVQNENSVMKDRINEDFNTINTLNHQISHLKSSYVAIKQEISCLSTSYDHQDSFQDHVLRENKNFGNVKLRNSLQTSCSEKHSLFLSNSLQYDQNSQNQKLRAYNMQILHKLDNAHKTITNLTSQVTNLKEQKSKLDKKNMFLEKKLHDLKKQQNRFMKELRNIGF